jgi:hypothetical protein
MDEFGPSEGCVWPFSIIFGSYIFPREALKVVKNTMYYLAT